jgi:hypothetical protein
VTAVVEGEQEPGDGAPMGESARARAERESWEFHLRRVCAKFPRVISVDAVRWLAQLSGEDGDQEPPG